MSFVFDCKLRAGTNRMGMGTWTRAAVLRELPAVRVGPSLATSLRIQTVVAAVEKAAKDVRVVVTLTAQIRTAHEHCSDTLVILGHHFTDFAVTWSQVVHCLQAGSEVVYSSFVMDIVLHCVPASALNGPCMG